MYHFGPVMDVNVVLEQAAAAIQRCLQALQSGATSLPQRRQVLVASQTERSRT